MLILLRVYRKFNQLVPGYPTDRPDMTLVCVLHKLLAQRNYDVSCSSEDFISLKPGLLLL